MRSSTSGDVDLLFVALHQANLQCSDRHQIRFVQFLFDFIFFNWNNPNKSFVSTLWFYLLFKM